jgi:hypothetical protein
MDAADVGVIDGREFASWSVLPGGTQARLDLVAGNGKPSSIDAGSIGPALLAASDHIEQPSRVRRPH